MKCIYCFRPSEVPSQFSRVFLAVLSSAPLEWNQGVVQNPAFRTFASLDHDLSQHTGSKTDVTHGNAEISEVVANHFKIYLLVPRDVT